MSLREIQSCRECSRIFYKGKWRKYDRYVIDWIDDHKDAVTRSLCDDCIRRIVQEEEQARLMERIIRMELADYGFVIN